MFSVVSSKLFQGRIILWRQKYFLSEFDREGDDLSNETSTSANYRPTESVATGTLTCDGRARRGWIHKIYYTLVECNPGVLPMFRGLSVCQPCCLWNTLDNR